MRNLVLIMNKIAQTALDKMSNTEHFSLGYDNYLRKMQKQFVLELTLRTDTVQITPIMQGASP